MDLESLCQAVVQISKEVGVFLRKEAQIFDLSQIEYKGMNDLVSYVDREAENKLVRRLREILPEAAFYTEEAEENQSLTAQPYHWIIDPLDGTTNFMHNLPIFAISIGLMHGQEMVLGVVYEVNREECFYAWKEGGAYCNGRTIRVSPVADLSDSLLATGFPYRDFDQVPAYLEIIKAFMQQTHGLRRMGSAAVDLAYVAMGRFQGFFEYNLNAWDVAAGALIIQEAGGFVSTFKGKNDFVFGREIVAAGPIHAQMLQLIQRYWH
ncbi:MAG: inositol monophosphatase [Microscillaceae bacterium]|nr:inositol monophosphatase [Microscillaceae bacterium]